MEQTLVLLQYSHYHTYTQQIYMKHTMYNLNIHRLVIQTLQRQPPSIEMVQSESLQSTQRKKHLQQQPSR